MTNAPDQQAVIDLAQLRLMTMEDPSLAAEALGIFRNQAEMWSRMLDPGEEPRSWADACHAIKGAARSIGAMALGEACAHAEQLGRGPAVTAAQAAVALNDVKDRLGEAIEAAAAVEHKLTMTGAFPEAQT